MKTSAIIRIVAGSITAVLLTAILLCGIYGWPFMGIHLDWPDSFGFGDFSYGYEDAESYQVGAGKAGPEEIREIEIHWDAGGKVNLIADDVAQIEFSEESEEALKEEERMRYLIKDGKLMIQYHGAVKLSGFFMKGLQTNKTLTVKIPAQLQQQLSQVEVESVEAPIYLNGIHPEKLVLSSTSGEIVAEECQADYMVADSVSGKIQLKSDFQSIQCSNVSGLIDVQTQTTPERMEMDTVEGDVRVSLPDQDGFIIDFETVSGEMDCQLPTTGNKTEFQYLDGGAVYRISTVSGNTTIAKAS